MSEEELESQAKGPVMVIVALGLVKHPGSRGSRQADPWAPPQPGCYREASFLAAELKCQRRSSRIRRLIKVRMSRNLTGRPHQVTSGEEMHMHVRHSLAGVFAMVDHQTKAFVCGFDAF